MFLFPKSHKQMQNVTLYVRQGLQTPRRHGVASVGRREAIASYPVAAVKPYVKLPSYPYPTLK